MTPEKDYPYIGVDEHGSRFNAMCPPDKKKYGVAYGGYKNNARQVLFYDFAVQGYDVEFWYGDKKYNLLYEPTHAALCDEKYSVEYETFTNPMEFIQNLVIDGKKLIDIIDKLEDVEPM